MDRLKILISAGEQSGDLMAAQLAGAVRRAAPGTAVFGMGGPRLMAAGCDVIRPMPEVMGLGSPVRNAGAVAASFAALAAAGVRRKADAAILVDFPDFHLALARLLAAAKIPVFQMVSPQIWAWRPGRIKALKKYVTTTFLIFPFEKKIYDEAGAPARFVGHPAVDRLKRLPGRAAARKKIGIASHAPVVALLPGSRRAVLDRHLPVFGAAAAAIADRIQGVTFVCSVVPPFDDAFYRAALGIRCPALCFSREEGPLILRAADAAVVSSGTGALEAVLAGTPFCGVYVTSPFTYNVVRRMAGVERILMANILAGRDVVREFIQYEARPESIADEVASLLRDSGRRITMARDFREVARMLGPGGAADRAARAVVGFCRRKNPS